MMGSSDYEALDLSEQRCLVLGGSGFIGTNLCRGLVTRVRSLKYFSRNPIDLDGAEWVSGDFLNNDDLVRAVADVDIVFHLISTSTPASSNANPSQDAQENLLQSIALLEFCKLSKVKKIIFVSSGGTVYGDAKVLPTPEGTYEQPICAYGVSKLAIEKYLHLYEKLYGISAIILRLSNPYGPFQYAKNNQGIIGAFIIKSLKGEAIEVWGDGSVVRDYVFISDVTEALIKAASYQGECRVFNIGSGRGTSVKSIVDELRAQRIVSLDVAYKEGRGIDVSKSILDCSLAKSEFGWEAVYDLESGISETYAWFKSISGVSPGK
jgi:UDP-glucose 4-epimerase